MLEALKKFTWSIKPMSSFWTRAATRLFETIAALKIPVNLCVWVVILCWLLCCKIVKYLM